MDNEKPWEERLRKWMSWTTTIGLALFTIVIGIMVVLAGFRGFWNVAVREHLPSVIGLPIAAISALVIVTVLRTVAGPIECKVLAFELKGAAGPIIMWMLCFLAMTLAIMKTWDLKACTTEIRYPNNSAKSQTRFVIPACIAGVTRMLE